MRKYHLLFLVIYSAYTFGQVNSTRIDKQEKIETIHTIKTILKENYIFPEITNKIISLVDKNIITGKYDSINNSREFAKILTEDIQSFNQDRHLRVLFEPDRIAKESKNISVEDSIRFEREYLLNLKRNNYFFKEVRILQGNIGYLDLRKFKDPKYAGETAVSAMNFLSNTDAVIIDLRNNGGGSPKMVQFIASYFFDKDVVQLSAVYKRKERITKQFWTLPFVPGKRMPNIPLFILTSSSTFSAAENFAYDLQSLKRAIIIGETTGGGAHPGGRIKASEKFNVWTPTGRALNPVTETNWEKVGVIPDIKTNKKDALKDAHIEALNILKSKNTRATNYYENILKTLKK